MNKFILFLAGLVAGLLLLANLGPLVLLGLSVWLLYLVFKQFMKANSTLKKIMWGLLGLVIVSIGLSNIYAVIGIAAAYVLYIVIKKWKGEPKQPEDPFVNFENQWGDLNKF